MRGHPGGVGFIVLPPSFPSSMDSSPYRELFVKKENEREGRAPPSGAGAAPDVGRRREAGPVVGGDLPESPAGLPVVPGAEDLVRGPADEVPPHEERLAEGRSPQKQEPGPARPAREGDPGAAQAQIDEGVDRKTPSLEGAPALEEDEGMLEVRVEGNEHATARSPREVRPHEGREVGNRGLLSRQGADDHGPLPSLELHLRKKAHLLEARRRLPACFREGDPELEPAKTA